MLDSEDAELSDIVSPQGAPWIRKGEARSPINYKPTVVCDLTAWDPEHAQK